MYLWKWNGWSLRRTLLTLPKAGENSLFLSPTTAEFCVARASEWQSLIKAKIKNKRCLLKPVGQKFDLLSFREDIKMIRSKIVPIKLSGSVCGRHFKGLFMTTKKKFSGSKFEFKKFSNFGEFMRIPGEAWTLNVSTKTKCENVLRRNVSEEGFLNYLNL